jgi:hypothetical protein
MMTANLLYRADKATDSSGTWKAKIIRRDFSAKRTASKQKKRLTLAEMNDRLSKGRSVRMAKAEKNCMEIVGRTRL